MFRKNQKNFIYLLVLVIPFFLLFTRSDFFTPIKTTVVQLSAFPMHVVSFSILEVKKFLFYRMAYEEYLKIKRENEALKTKMAGFNDLIQENSRLSSLLEYKRNLVYSSVAAGIIGRDPTYWNSSLIINKGARQGIAPGMPVIHPSGVVGKIAEVYANSSKVIVLTDPQFSVAAVLEDSRESGLLSGALRQDLCRLKYINHDAQIKVGDLVVTSRVSTSFPENLLIGQVAEIFPSTTGSPIECMVKPVVNISQLEEVLVIKK